MKLSAGNQISARVTGVTRGEATANVELDARGVRPPLVGVHGARRGGR
jgi:molybdopterin-binding protein